MLYIYKYDEFIIGLALHIWLIKKIAGLIL